MHVTDGSHTRSQGQVQGRNTENSGTSVQLAYGRDSGCEQAPDLYLDTNEVKGGTSSKPRYGTSGIDTRLAKLGKHASNARKFALWIGSKDQHRSDKMDACGSWLQFREYFAHPESPTKLAGGNFCQQPLLCGMCASRRAARQVQQLRDKLVHVLQNHPGQVPYFVTLTARSQPDLKAMISDVWGAWSKLWERRKDVMRGRSSSIAGEMDGGFLHGEAKRGKGGRGWHFHLHGIIVANGGLYKPKWERLTKEWAGLMNQEWASVEFKPLHGWKEAAKLKDPSEFNFTKSLIETCKYAVKWDGDGCYEDRWDAFKSLSNVRNLRTFGAFRGIKFTDELTDDLTGLENEEYRELVYQFIGGHYHRKDTASAEAPKPCSILEEWNNE